MKKSKQTTGLPVNPPVKPEGAEGTGQEAVNHPPHYGGDTPYEVIKVLEAWGCGFHLGNAIKYIARAGKKPFNHQSQDLEKAIWYIRRYLDYKR